jgi:hypothetical protein
MGDTRDLHHQGRCFSLAGHPRIPKSQARSSEKPLILMSVVEQIADLSG